MHNTPSPRLSFPNKRQEESYYNYALKTAEWLIVNEQPVPLDLIMELEDNGIIFKEMEDRILNKENLGFQYVH